MGILRRQEYLRKLEHVLQDSLGGIRFSRCVFLLFYVTIGVAGTINRQLSMRKPQNRSGKRDGGANSDADGDKDFGVGETRVFRESVEIYIDPQSPFCAEG